MSALFVPHSNYYYWGEGVASEYDVLTLTRQEHPEHGVQQSRQRSNPAKPKVTFGVSVGVGVRVAVEVRLSMASHGDGFGSHPSPSDQILEEAMTEVHRSGNKTKTNTL